MQNSTPQNISCESGSCTEQDDADWLSSGGARDYGLLKTATNKTVRFVKYHLPMRINLLFVLIGRHFECIAVLAVISQIGLGFLLAVLYGQVETSARQGSIHLTKI